jgi:hypothetical protein
MNVEGDVGLLSYSINHEIQNNIYPIVFEKYEKYPSLFHSRAYTKISIWSKGMFYKICFLLGVFVVAVVTTTRVFC